jgi:Ca-activated chloride channel homolog
MTFSLEFPVVAMLAVVAFIAALVASRGGVVRGVVPALRVAALLVLALAVANPNLSSQRPGLVILEDVSDSASRLDGLDAVRVKARLPFAGLAGASGTERGALRPSETSIASALQVARSYNPSRVLLVSDGNQTIGDALEALPGVPVDVLNVPTRENARVAELLAPATLAPGGTARAVAVLESTRATKAQIVAKANGNQLFVKPVNLGAGRTSVPIDFTAPSGSLQLEVSVRVDYAQPTLDDTKSLGLQVSRERQVLVIGDPALSRLLRAQGFNVRDGRPQDITASMQYSAVFVREAATNFTRGQLETLKRFVEDGGGVMLTGGPRSFGLGGWARSPLEAVMPVQSDLRTRVDVPLVAMVMVLDRSLSMAGTGGGADQKLSLALEGVSNVIELANERDFLGVVTFSDTPKWAFKPTRATESNKLQMFRALQSVEAEGGTILEPALRDAIAALRESRAAIKHIILLTDGQLADAEGNANPPDFNRIARSAKAANITVSSIAVGGDADFARLKQIAQAGGGRYYEALQVDTLPRIFTTEALTATRALVRTEGVRPQLIKHPLSAGVSGAPPRLSAYIATTLKSDAEQILVGSDREPILAVTRKGVGRTAALTADLNRADTFTAWTALPNLIGTVARWLEAAETPYSLSISPDGRRAVVDAVARNQYQNNLRLEVRVSGQRLEMTQTAPGRYETRLPEDATGSVSLVRAGEPIANVRLNRDARELETTGGEALLRGIAERSGGRVLSSLQGYASAVEVSRVTLAGWAALLGLVLLIAELAYRRFRA